LLTLAIVNFFAFGISIVVQNAGATFTKTLKSITKVQGTLALCLLAFDIGCFLQMTILILERYSSFRTRNRARNEAETEGSGGANTAWNDTDFRLSTFDIAVLVLNKTIGKIAP
jgi:hypothetical protein